MYRLTKIGQQKVGKMLRSVRNLDFCCSICMAESKFGVNMMKHHCLRVYCESEIWVMAGADKSAVNEEKKKE